MKPLKEKNIKEYEEYDNHEESESDESTEDDNIETTNFYAPRKNVVVGARKTLRRFFWINQNKRRENPKRKRSY